MSGTFGTHLLLNDQGSSDLFFFDCQFLKKCAIKYKYRRTSTATTTSYMPLRRAALLK
jgi:hypothetical protein